MVSLARIRKSTRRPSEQDFQGIRELLNIPVGYRLALTADHFGNFCINIQTIRCFQRPLFLIHRHNFQTSLPKTLLSSFRNHSQPQICSSPLLLPPSLPSLLPTPALTAPLPPARLTSRPSRARLRSSTTRLLPRVATLLVCNSPDEFTASLTNLLIECILALAGETAACGAAAAEAGVSKFTVIPKVLTWTHN